MSNLSILYILPGPQVIEQSLFLFSPHLVVEEVYGVLVEPEGERLEEGDVVGHHLLVGEVELVHDDGVHVVVGQEIV